VKRFNAKWNLVPNGPRRPGQYKHHDENCQVEDHGIGHTKKGNPFRAIWCATHGQWAIENPVKVEGSVHTFANGDTATTKLS